MVAGGDQIPIGQRAAAVRERVLLSAVIGQRVALSKAGRELTGLCPFHSDTRVGSFMVNDEKGIFKCFACAAHGDVIDFVEKSQGKSFIEALRLLEAEAGIDFGSAKHRALLNPEWEKQKERRLQAAADEQEKRRRKAERLWHHAVPMLGTPAQDYLARERSVDFAAIGRLPRAIRYMPDCWRGGLRMKVPAMVTAIMGIDGRHLATHVTYLAKGPGGWSKAKVVEVTLPDGRVEAHKPKIIRGTYTGGHIPINKGEDRRPLKDIGAGVPIFISEGIEDALTVAMAMPGARIVAAAVLGNIGTMDLPPQIGPVTLIGQNDAEGSGGDQGVAKAIGQLQARGFTVKTMWPRAEFKDFNDQLRGVAMERAA